MVVAENEPIAELRAGLPAGGRAGVRAHGEAGGCGDGGAWGGAGAPLLALRRQWRVSGAALEQGRSLGLQMCARAQVADRRVRASAPQDGLGDRRGGLLRRGCGYPHELRIQYPLPREEQVLAAVSQSSPLLALPSRTARSGVRRYGVLQDGSLRHRERWATGRARNAAQGAQGAHSRLQAEGEPESQV